jgi:hypothetical protein
VVGGKINQRTGEIEDDIEEEYRETRYYNFWYYKFAFVGNLLNRKLQNVREDYYDKWTDYADCHGTVCDWFKL